MDNHRFKKLLFSKFSEQEYSLFREAFFATLPTLFGLAAWGLVVGIAMVKSGLSIEQALAMTLLVFGGSCQLAALPLMIVHTPLWMIFITALMINLRFVIFSALLAPHFQALPLGKKIFYSYLSGDMTVAQFIQRDAHTLNQEEKSAYLKGLIYPNWIAWQIGSIIGILFASQIPTQWHLEFAGALALLCIVIPMIFNRAALCGVLVAGAISLFAYSWPYKIGLLAAVVGGMSIALLIDTYSETHNT